MSTTETQPAPSNGKRKVYLKPAQIREVRKAMTSGLHLAGLEKPISRKSPVVAALAKEIAALFDVNHTTVYKMTADIRERAIRKRHHPATAGKMSKADSGRLGAAARVANIATRKAAEASHDAGIESMPKAHDMDELQRLADAVGVSLEVALDRALSAWRRELAVALQL